MTRRSAVLAAAASVLWSACGGVRGPRAPSLFPVSTVFRIALDDAIEGPLASDGSRVFAATRDGAVVALDRHSGAQAWRVPSRPGVVAFGSGILVVRGPAGTVWGLDPATGNAHWKSETGVAGTLPPAVAGDRVLVAGDGLVSLEAATGRTVWAHADAARASAVPVVAGPWILVGEAEGTLRCRDAATGAARWALPTGGPVLAAPVVDDRQRILVGTTGRRFLALGLERGNARWRWRTGADVQVPAALFQDKVLVASHENVLYALKRGNGHLVWRAPLPSRPLSGPLVVGTAALVACHEDEVVGFDCRTGSRLGGLRAPAEIKAPPIVVGDTLYLGLRDRSIVALKLGAETEPAEPPKP